jgi:hypothetical protein
MKLSHVAICSLFLASAAAARQNPPDPQAQSPFEYGSCFLWPTWPVWPDTSYTHPGEVGKMLGGHFDGDGLFDFVVRLGERLAYVGAIGARDVVRWVALPLTGDWRLVTVLDYDVAPNVLDVCGVSEEALYASIVYVDEDGLKCAYLVPYTTPQNLSSQQFVGETLEASAWAGALAVRARDINADGVTDFVGVAADGSSILVTNGVDLATTTLTTPGTVAQLEVLRWDANATFEIAALIGTSAYILRQDGSVFDSYTSSAGTAGTMEVIEGASRDRVAWTYTIDSQPWIALLRYNAAPEGPQLLPVTSACALATGDIDGNRNDEVLECHPTYAGPLYVPNLFPSAPNLSVSNSAWVEGSYDKYLLNQSLIATGILEAAGNLATADNASLGARPLFADINNDARADAVISRFNPSVRDHLSFTVLYAAAPVEASGGGSNSPSSMGAWDPVSAAGQPSFLVDCEPQPNKIYRGSAVVTLDQYDVADGLSFDFDMTYNSTSCPIGADALRVTVWFQGADHLTLCSEALVSYDYDLPVDFEPTDPTRVTVALTRTRLEEMLLSDFLDEETPPQYCSAAVFWFEFDMIERIENEMPIVYSTRFIGIDHSTADPSPLVLAGGTIICSLGMDDEPGSLCPDDGPEAVDGPITIVRKPRMPAMGYSEYPEVPTTITIYGGLTQNLQ